MTHRQILLAELQVHGRTTYRELLARYGGRGYTYAGFVAAAWRLRRCGVIAPPQPEYHAAITRAGARPCCGRAYKEATA